MSCSEPMAADVHTAPRSHESALARAFDGQAAAFERAPVQSDRAALRRLVSFANLATEGVVLDAGCGPGLVAEALLEAGHRVVGVDVSGEMIRRAAARCARFGDRAMFIQGSLFDSPLAQGFDASISRYVLHHVTDPHAFVARQVELLRPGGVLVLSDHTTDPDTVLAAWHQEIERARDVTHTRNLTPGEIVDLCAAAGLDAITHAEESFTLDFDEWFDRGTPDRSKDAARLLLLSGPGARGFRPIERPDGSVQIDCHRTLVRGIKGDSNI